MGGFFLLDKVVKLVGGGSVINGAYPVWFFLERYNLRTRPYIRAFNLEDVAHKDLL